MTKEEKILQLVNDKILLEKYKKEFKTLHLNLQLDEKPVPYSRERYTRFGNNNKGRFYNKRAQYMTRIKEIFKKQVSKKDKDIINTIMKNSDTKPYYVKISGIFYVPIPKSDSITISAMKEAGMILPDINRGDIDNYMKLILDVLHDVIYHDDKVVVNINASKKYSLNPRVELFIDIEYQI